MPKDLCTVPVSLDMTDVTLGARNLWLATRTAAGAAAYGYMVSRYTRVRRKVLA